MSGQEVRFQGIGVAPGIARGVVFVHHPDDEEPPKRRVEDSEVAKEIVRFEAACSTWRSTHRGMQGVPSAPPSRCAQASNSVT